MESLTTSSEPSSSSSSWRILEFYSGIGGMRYSLKRAMGGRGVVVEAFEINDIANDVYEFNFSHRPYQGNIHSLTPAELDKYRADAWLLSPPCQPYTRQGLRKDSADARASSFIKLLQAISSMQHPPLVMFVENVVGFETSDTHRQLMEVLDANDFVTQEFILSPMQFDVPYSRPRYFCLAKRKPLSFINPSLNGQLLHTPPTGTCKSDTLIDQQPNVRWEEPGLSCSPIKKFLQSGCSSNGSVEDEEFLPGKPTDHNKDCKNNQHGSSADVSVLEVGRDGLVPNSQVSVWASGNNHLTSMNGYAVPLRLIERWGSAMDVVFPDSKRCCCFTKSYYRYVKGTGSLLATAQVVEKSELVCLENLGLRYFTPREVANFHSFPEDFDFPLHITKKQRYALLGNSLSVAVVAPLLQYLFVESTQLLS